MMSPSRSPTARGAAGRSAHRSAGFSLIELMIVVAVMAILAAASVVSYRNYIQRSNRVDATAALLRIAGAQERFYLQNNRYATTADELNGAPPAGLGIEGTEHGYYDLSVDAGPDGAVLGYLARATARADATQRDDVCQSFTIDHTNERTATLSDGTTGDEARERCWR